MKAYLLSIAGIVLISAIVTVICPGGKTGNFVRGAVRLFILVVMLSPLAGWLQKGTPQLGEQAAIAEDKSYLEKCASMLEARDEEDAEAFLLREFGMRGRAEAARRAESGFPRVKIALLLEKEGIIEEGERIHILTDIREAFEERYGCPAEVAYED